MILAIWCTITALLAIVGVFAIHPKWFLILVFPKYYCAKCKEEMEASNKYALEIKLQSDKPFNFRQV